MAGTIARIRPKRSWFVIRVAGLCLGGLLLVAGLGLWLVDRRIVKSVEGLAREAPDSWMRELRASATLPPEAQALAPQRTVDGNGAYVVYHPDTTGPWWALRPFLERALGVIERQFPNHPEAFSWQRIDEDSAVWAALVVDSSFNQFVRAAAAREWDALRAAGVMSRATYNDVYELGGPSRQALRAGARALAIRSHLRMLRGQRDTARRDLAAVIGLGVQLVRHEPNVLPALYGRELMSIGAGALALQAEFVRDTALHRQATAVLRWSRRRPVAGYGWRMWTLPESALAVAADTGLAPAWRAEALMSLLEYRLRRPAGWLFGIPQRRLDQIAQFTRDPDPEFVRLAQLVLRTGEWLNDLGPLWRYRMRRYYEYVH